MVKIRLTQASLYQHLEDIFSRLNAADTVAEKLDAIDRAWFEVWAMNRIIAGDGATITAAALPIEKTGELPEYAAMRYLLFEALKRLEAMFDQLASQDESAQSSYSSR